MALAKSLASEYASSGIRVNAVSMPDMRDNVPIGRLGKPEDVADVVAFLCSAHSDYVTREVVDITGGFLSRPGFSSRSRVSVGRGSEA